jgi:hypothetical protein
LSGFVILDPSTGQWVSGSGYTISQPSLNRRQPDDPQPQDDPGNGGSPPDPGFYQVVRDGVYIVGLTNLTGGPVLSDTVTIAFEAGNADPNNGTNLIGTLSGAVLLVDGLKFAGEGGLSAPPTYPWQFAMDTAYLENGDHSLEVEVFWSDPSGDDSTESLYPSRYSDSIMITVSNSIYYPQWEEDIGEPSIAAYYANTTCTNADWSIDIYDVNTNFVQSLTGHTDDGTIEAYWNMVDTNGVVRTNADVDPEFSSVLTVADPVTKKLPPKKNPKRDWPAQGMWTVTFQDYFRHWYDNSLGYMQGNINAFANTAAKYGGCLLYYPPPGQTNLVGQTYPLRYQNPKHPEDGITTDMLTMDYSLLRSFLASTNSRNFFYRGHGNATSIGDLESSTIKVVVGQRRYRFALLQSCQSADGDLDHAFGIKGPESYTDVSHYQAIGKRPAAFVGNHGDTRFANPGREQIGGVWYDGRIPWQIAYFYGDFLFWWDADTEGTDLWDAINDAVTDLPPIDNWPYEDNPGRHLIIYGYEYLHIDEYNHASDWP